MAQIEGKDGPYSSTNPPPSEEAAQARIDILVTRRVRIESQIETWTRNEFPSESAYRDWKSRAQYARRHLTNEIQFLERAIKKIRVNRKMHSGKHQLKPGLWSAEMRAVMQRAQTKANELAAEIGSSYTQQFSPTNLPQTFEEARNRQSEIVIVKQQIVAACSEITAMWSEHPLPHQAGSQVKKPLTLILATVEEEIIVLRGYIRDFEATCGALDWRRVCLQAISRAVDEGFALTAEEQQVFNLLRERYIKFLQQKTQT